MRDEMNLRKTWLGVFVIGAIFAGMSLETVARGQEVSLQSVVIPSTAIVKDRETVKFAVHGFIEFRTLAELFAYIEAEKTRWTNALSVEQRRKMAEDLLRRGIESRVVSMKDERALETLVTHTEEELREAIAHVKEPVPEGYTDAFLAVQEKWKHSLNCWSASPAIAGRVLSNWYPIEEGIALYGATYDSTEHFWQSVKYHPDLRIAEVNGLIDLLKRTNWTTWLKRLESDPRIYLPNAYAVEFLRHNLTVERLKWFREELVRQGLKADEKAREAQQRRGKAFRFSAYEEKVLWGDLADLFHLVYVFSQPDDAIRTVLAEKHFDGIYLGDRKMVFISEEFRSLMLEIWKVKYLKMERFREVIAGIPEEIRLSHFLNDGDSPDIPIPVYVSYLNEIQEMARTK
jgi:hypothetical protein